MSNYINNIFGSVLLLGVLLTTNLVKAELEASSSNDDSQQATATKVVIRKCCKENEILVESNIGARSCKLRSNYIEGKVDLLQNCQGEIVDIKPAMLGSSTLCPHFRVQRIAKLGATIL